MLAMNFLVLIVDFLKYFLSCLKLFQSARMSWIGSICFSHFYGIQFILNSVISVEKLAVILNYLFLVVFIFTLLF